MPTPNWLQEQRDREAKQYKQDQRIVDAMNGVHSNIPSVVAPSQQLEKDTTRVTEGQ